MSVSRPSRTVAVGTTPVSIRKVAVGISDPLALPVTFSRITVPSGGGYVQFVPFSNSIYTDGEEVIPAGTSYTDNSQALDRYLISSAGTVNVLVTDYSA